MKSIKLLILAFTLTIYAGCQSPTKTNKIPDFEIQSLTGVSFSAADDSRWVTKFLVQIANDGIGRLYQYSYDRSDGASYYTRRDITIRMENGVIYLVTGKGVRIGGAYGQAGGFRWPLGYDKQKNIWYPTNSSAHFMGRVEFRPMNCELNFTDQEAIKLLQDIPVTTTPTKFMQIAAALKGTAEVLSVARDTAVAYENAKSGNSGKINPSNSLSQATLTSMEMSAYTDGYAYNVQTLIPAQTMGEFIVYYGVTKEMAQDLLETGYSIAGDRSEYGPGNPQTTISWQRIKVGVGSRISVGSESQARTMPPRKFGNPYHTNKP
jgi:hypothetical protein